MAKEDLFSQTEKKIKKKINRDCLLNRHMKGPAEMAANIDGMLGREETIYDRCRQIKHDQEVSSLPRAHPMGSPGQYIRGLGV